MNPAFKKYGQKLVRKLSPLVSGKISLAETRENTVAEDFWHIAAPLWTDYQSENECFDQISKAVTAYDKFKQKYADAQGDNLTQFNRFATKEFDTHMLALKLLVSIPSHNQIIDTALIEQHFAAILNINPSRFKIKLGRQLSFTLSSPAELDPQARVDEAKNFSQFHEALQYLGIIRNNSLESRASEMVITHPDPSPVLTLAQFEISDQPIARTSSRRKTVAEPSAPDKKLIQVAVHLKELVKTEHDFVKQMKVLSDALAEKGEEGCQVLLKATGGHNSAAKNNLEQKIPKLYESLEQNKYIVRAELESEGVILTDAEEFVLKNLEQYYLLKNAIGIFKTIACNPYPWLDEKLVAKILKATPEEMAQDDLREWLTQLYNKVKANSGHIASHIVALRWITVHFNDLRKILNDQSIVKFDTKNKISVGITGMQGETVEKTQQEIKDTYLISPVQRLPRYDMLLKELMTSFNKVTLENLSINNFSILDGLVFLRKFFLARNQSTNERVRKHEQDQARDKPKGNEQNASSMQDSVGLFFSALNAFFSSVSVKSSVQGGDAGSLESMGQSMLGAFDSAPHINLEASFLNQSFRSDQSDLDQQPDEAFGFPPQFFLSSLSQSKLSSSRIERSMIQSDQAEIENLLQKQEDIQVKFTDEEDAYKKLNEALNASEKVHEVKIIETIVDPSQHEEENLKASSNGLFPASVLVADPEKPKKVLPREPVLVVEMQDAFSLYIHNSFNSSIDLAFQEFGPDFEQDEAKPPISIKEVKSSILSISKKVCFANKPDLKSSTHKTNAKPTDKIVWYVDADKEDPKQVKEWASNTWNDIEKHRGYFIVVGHGDFEAFKEKWGATVVVAEVISPVPQPAEPQKEPEKLKIEVINPIPQPKPKEPEQAQVPQLEPQKAEEPKEVVNPVLQLEPSPVPQPAPVVVPIVFASTNSLEPQTKVEEPKELKVRPDIPQPKRVKHKSVEVDAQPQGVGQPPSSSPKVPQTGNSDKKVLREVFGEDGHLKIVEVTDDPQQILSAEIASKNRAKNFKNGKTFLKGFFNPSVWGIAMLLSMVVGIGAGALVGYSEPFFDIMMSVGVSALPVFAGLWAISTIVYLVRLAQLEDPVNGKPSDVFKGMVGFGMTVGAAAILAAAILMIMGGVPSELAFIKPLFEMIGHFFSTGLKVMGLDVLSDAFTVGGDLSSGVAAFLIIAAPVLFVFILAERLVTAYCFSDEGGEVLDGLQPQPDLGKDYEPVPEQPKADLPNGKVLDEQAQLEADARPRLYSLLKTVEKNMQSEARFLDSRGIKEQDLTSTLARRFNALHELNVTVKSSLEVKSQNDPDCLAFSATCGKKDAVEVAFETKDTNFLKTQADLLEQGLEEIDRQYPSEAPKPNKLY